MSLYLSVAYFLSLWAAWSSLFRELISCFRYCTSDSLTRSITSSS
uniref:Uncharacterized protein n=1 Tax=Anguilla anguilla TaxID=7936 RepID=A0A0E9VW03_ANGAN